MSGDRRIQKTEDAIRRSFTELLGTTAFDDITITKLCDKAQISRITFYAHYSDKYALVDAMFQELIDIATTEFKSLQDANNPDDDMILSFCNLIDAILNLYHIEVSMLSFTKAEENPHIHYIFYSYVSKNVQNILAHYSSKMKFNYSLQQISGLICNGMWAFISEARAGKQPVEEIKRDSKRVLSAIIQYSGLVENAVPEG